MGKSDASSKTGSKSQEEEDLKSKKAASSPSKKLK
jgi:hypothetical protein